MKGRPANLPPPYLQRIWLDRTRVTDATAYPFCPPFLAEEFELEFKQNVVSTARLRIES